MIPSQCRAGRRWVFTLPAVRPMIGLSNLQRRAHNILRVTSEQNRMKGYSYGLAAITVAFVTSFRLDMPYGAFSEDLVWSMYHRRRLKEHIPQFLDANGDTDGDYVHRTELVCIETRKMYNDEDILNPRSKFHVLLRRLAYESEVRCHYFLF
jgi:hypothetical protein